MCMLRGLGIIREWVKNANITVNWSSLFYYVSDRNICLQIMIKFLRHESHLTSGRHDILFNVLTVKS